MPLTELGDSGIGTVGGHQELNQIVRSDTEEVRALGQFFDHEDDARHFKHYADADGRIELLAGLFHRILDRVDLVEHEVPYNDIANILVVLPGLLTMLTLGAWGRLLDRWNPISMRTLTMAIWSVQPLLLYFAPRLSEAFGISLVAPVYAAFFFRGLAFGGSSLIWFLGAMYFASKDDVPIYMGLHLALTGLRMILAPQAAAWLANVYSFETTFLVSYGLMMFALLLVVVLGSIEKRAGRLLSFAEREEHNEPFG